VVDHRELDEHSLLIEPHGDVRRQLHDFDGAAADEPVQRTEQVAVGDLHVPDIAVQVDHEGVHG
jgi:hypothetical protein